MNSLCFLTDFGTKDAYVGVLHGVAAGVSPLLRTFDLCHSVSPQNIAGAAYVLKSAYRFFPPGTVFVVVIDPGVGTSRKLLAAHSGGMYFIAPDNGLLPAALCREKKIAYREITRRPNTGRPVSCTFHGRDIMSPLGAMLATGSLTFSGAGPACQQPFMMERRLPVCGGKKWTGEVIHLDHFGNAVTNIEKRHLAKRRNAPETALVKRRKLMLVKTYRENSHTTKPIALFNSEDHLEIAIPGGSAAEIMGLKPGDRISLQ